MRLPALATALSLALSPALASQGEVPSSKYYFQLGPGFAEQMDSQGFTRDITFENGYTLSALVGRRTSWIDSDRCALSLEVEGLYVDAEVDSDGLLAAGSSTLEDLTTTAFLLNGVLDWDWSEDVTFYVGGGVGYAPVIDLASFEDGPPGVNGRPRTFELNDEEGIAWQGKVGLRYHLGADRNYSFLLGLRYFQTEDVEAEDPEVPGSFDLENRVLAVEAGFRWGI